MKRLFKILSNNFFTLSLFGIIFLSFVTPATADRLRTGYLSDLFENVKKRENIPKGKSVIYVYSLVNNPVLKNVEAINGNVFYLRANSYYPIIVDSGKLDFRTTVNIARCGGHRCQSTLEPKANINILSSTIEKAFYKTPVTYEFEYKPGQNYYLKYCLRQQCNGEGELMLWYKFVPEKEGIEDLKKCQRLPLFADFDSQNAFFETFFLKKGRLGLFWHSQEKNMSISDKLVHNKGFGVLPYLVNAISSKSNIDENLQKRIIEEPIKPLITSYFINIFKKDFENMGFEIPIVKNISINKNDFISDVKKIISEYETQLDKIIILSLSGVGFKQHHYFGVNKEPIAQSAVSLLSLDLLEKKFNFATLDSTELSSGDWNQPPDYPLLLEAGKNAFKHCMKKAHNVFFLNKSTITHASDVK